VGGRPAGARRGEEHRQRERRECPGKGIRKPADPATRQGSRLLDRDRRPSWTSARREVPRRPRPLSARGAPGAGGNQAGRSAEAAGGARPRSSQASAGCGWPAAGVEPAVPSPGSGRPGAAGGASGVAAAC
jgi:hypothetical protein